MKARLRVAWERWKLIAETIARVQARVLFAILYVIVVAPFAIGVRLLADPLDLRPQARKTRWRELGRQTSTLDGARRQS